ncbi:MAG: hypothetical protein JNM24_17635 [Bdellovibrionaceae bacterium]|nr:hypothetical protein [Pseudobdellovibrionaceae bacterium]
MQLLTRKGFVESFHYSSQGTYYMTSQSLVNRLKAAKFSDCSPEKLKQSLIRKQDLFHNQWCEYWIVAIKRFFPNAQIIRESEILNDSFAKNILSLTYADYELRPDFLLTIPKTETTNTVCVAFEIERTRKSDERILRKLGKYMDRTQLDGLIYICDSGRLSETIRLLYQNNLLPKSEKQKRFGENFFLFSDALDAGGETFNRLFNACGKPTSFTNWCGYLGSIEWTKRRSEDLKNW